MLKPLSIHTKRKIERLLANTGDMALKRRARRIIEELNPQNGDKILEVGCGDGFCLYVLSNLKLKIILYGIDLNSVAIESAKKNLKNKKVRLFVGSATRLPFKTSSFNKIIMSEVSEHIPDDTEALKEVYRVLKPGGLLLITVPNSNYPFFWDPINWMAERFFNIKLQKGMWGIWAQHLRLYKPKEILQKLKKAKFNVEYIESQIRWALPFKHYLITLGAVLLSKNSVSSGTRYQVSKFEKPKGRKTGIIKIFFDFSNFIDRFNKNISLNDPAEGIFLVCRK